MCETRWLFCRLFLFCLQVFGLHQRVYLRQLGDLNVLFVSKVGVLAADYLFSPEQFSSQQLDVAPSSGLHSCDLGCELQHTLCQTHVFTCLTSLFSLHKEGILDCLPSFVCFHCDNI